MRTDGRFVTISEEAEFYLSKSMVKKQNRKRKKKNFVFLFRFSAIALRSMHKYFRLSRWKRRRQVETDFRLESKRRGSWTSNRLHSSFAERQKAESRRWRRHRKNKKKNSLFAQRRNFYFSFVKTIIMTGHFYTCHFPTFSDEKLFVARCQPIVVRNKKSNSSNIHSSTNFEISLNDDMSISSVSSK